MAKTRDLALDWIKGFLIICVVAGHTERVGTCHSILDGLRDVIYGFHIPLFLFLSGYFFKIEDPYVMLKKCLHRLVIPYLVSACLFNSLYIITGQRSVLKAVANIACGRMTAALWFLYAIAFIEIVIAIGVWCYRFTGGGCYDLCNIICHCTC